MGHPVKDHNILICLLDRREFHDLVELVVVEEVVDLVDGGDVLLQRERPHVGLGCLKVQLCIVRVGAIMWIGLMHGFQYIIIGLDLLLTQIRRVISCNFAKLDSCIS